MQDWIADKAIHTALASCFLMVIFAEGGEFFVFKINSHKHKESEIAEKHLEMPTHVPDSHEAVKLCAGNKCKSVVWPA